MKRWWCEVAHHRFQVAFAHLAVRHADARFRQQRLQLLQHVVDGVDFVVQEVHLPAALEFAQHGFADDALAEAADEGLDGQAALRRGGDHREIAQAFQRHRQRARDRRGGEREHIHFGAQRLQSFFLLHAETVLFVEDDQAEVVELHVLLDQLVRADDDVQLAFGQVLQRLRHFLGRAEARQLGDLDRPVGEAVGEILEVLFGQQRGGHQHRDLLAIHHRDEGGAQGDFGLAEAHVAADEPVHRLAGLQVEQHGFDGGGLVGGFFETEAGGERFVVVIGELEGVAFARGALRVDVQQLGGGVAHLLHGAALGLVPGAAAQLVQRCGFRRAAAVAADDVQLRDGHVELVLARIFQQQEFVLAFAEVEVHQALIARDAVLLMHHRVARLELGQVAQHAFHVALLRGARGAASGLRGIQLGLGDDGELVIRQREADLDGADAEHEFVFAGEEGCVVFAHGGREAVFLQVAGHDLAAAEAVGEQQYASGVDLQEVLEGVGGDFGLAVYGDGGDGEVAQGVRFLECFTLTPSRSS